MINKKHLTYINHRYVQIIITHLYSLKLIMMSAPQQHNRNRNIQKISQQTSKQNRVCNCLCLVIFSDYCQCIHVDYDFYDIGIRPLMRCLVTDIYDVCIVLCMLNRNVCVFIMLIIYIYIYLEPVICR